MNLAETVKTNRAIIALIYEKHEICSTVNLPSFDRHYVEQLEKNNIQAERYLGKVVTK